MDTTRAVIDSVMRSKGLYERSRAVLKDAMSKSNGTSEESGDVFDALRRSGLVDELLAGVKETGMSLDAATISLLHGGASQREDGPSVSERPAQPAAAHSQHAGNQHSDAAETSGISDLDPTRRYLLLRFPGKARAFLAHLDGEGTEEGEEGEEGEGGKEGQRVRRFYVLHFFCRGSRWQSPPVPATTDPDFRGPTPGEDGGAALAVDVTPGEQGVLPPVSALLGLPEPDCRLHIVVTLITQRPRPGEPSMDLSMQALHGGGGQGHPPPPVMAGDTVTDVVAMHTLDWRTVLSNPGCRCSQLLSLPSVGPGPHGPVPNQAAPPCGLLPLSMEVWPLVPSGEEGGAAPLDETIPAPDAVRSALTGSTSHVSSASRDFYTYAKAWWGEYKGLHAAFRTRPVRIFGESETGEHLPAMTYLCPLQADRAIDSPAAAARFVSLLPYRVPDNGLLGGSYGARAPWRALHATLAARGGDGTAHALLLCSLLLGLGCDAYVCIGMRADPGGGEEEYCWVATRYPVAQANAAEERPGAGMASPGAGSPIRGSPAHPSEPSYRVLFWDPLTGTRCAPGDTLPTGHIYSKVACMFSHARFYACTAGDDSAATLSWALESALCPDWKGMDAGMCESLACMRAAPPPVAPATVEARAVAAALEAVLKAAIQRYRSLPSVSARIASDCPPPAAKASPGSGEQPWATRWDDSLAYVMGQALASYETERMHGVTAGVEDFAVAIKRAIPRGHAFRAFPILFNHGSPGRILDALLAAQAGREVLETAAHTSTAFALRVQVHVHAEDCTAVWLMVAVRTPLLPVGH